MPRGFTPTPNMSPANESDSLPKAVFNASTHPVRSVTVFSAPPPGIAQVTRAFSIELRAGANPIRVIRLPATLDAASVQVTIGVVYADNDSADKPALSEEEVRVIDVACMLKEDADAKGQLR